MKKASFVVLPFYQNNKVFDLSSPVYNRDNCLYPFVLLRAEFAKLGYDLSTQDINPIAESELVIYLDMPKVLPKREAVAKSFLLIYETDVISPKNWNLQGHNFFNKIFTWNDSYVDGKKYFKMNWSYPLPEKVDYSPVDKTHFCCLIAGNKTAKHHLELYSARVEAIRWFEKHHPDKFDLYGIGWNELQIPGRRFFEQYRLLKLIKIFLSVFAEKYPSYRGRIDRKHETLKKYKFSICYENVRDVSGYITEKIFDCIFSGCVPIYWGASNITEHIPAECFIDKRQYDTYESLYNYLDNMNESDYNGFIAAMQAFLLSEKSQQFSAEYFARSVSKHILS